MNIGYFNPTGRFGIPVSAAHYNEPVHVRRVTITSAGGLYCRGVMEAWPDEEKPDAGKQ